MVSILIFSMQRTLSAHNDRYNGVRCSLTFEEMTDFERMEIDGPLNEANTLYHLSCVKLSIQ